MFKKPSIGQKRRQRPTVQCDMPDESTGTIPSNQAVSSSLDAHAAPSKRAKKGLAASELMKPTGKEQSYISQKFSAGTVTKKDELEDRLVGLISTKDRELLSLAEKNQYIQLKGMSVEKEDEAGTDKAQSRPKPTPAEALSALINPKQQKELTTIMQFKHSNDSKKVQEVGGLPTAIVPDDEEDQSVVARMKRDLYAIPTNLDVDKIKQSKVANFADRTAVHIKNGLTEVQLTPTWQTDQLGHTKQLHIEVAGTNRSQLVTTNVPSKPTTTVASSQGTGRMTKEARKEIFKQLMTVQGSQARRNKAKEEQKQREQNRKLESNSQKLQ